MRETAHSPNSPLFTQKPRRVTGSLYAGSPGRPEVSISFLLDRVPLWLAAHTGAKWRYVRINQTDFDSQGASSLGDLVDDK